MSVSTNNLKILLGSILTLAYLIFAVLSIPVYIFRQIVIFLAKWFCPDLGEIMDGQSAQYVSDLYGPTPPRVNIVMTMIFEGHLKLDEVKALILKNWINARNPKTGQALHPKFQQYPANWMGFTFWKNTFDTFSIDNHIQTMIGYDKFVSEIDLEDCVEKLLNGTFLKQQSPWEFHLIENCQYKKQGGHSVLLLKYHHCLADGYAMCSLLIKGLTDIVSVTEIGNMPQPSFRKKSFVQQVRFFITLPVTIFFELSCLFAHCFSSSPWKVPDEKKAWHQVCTNSDPVPVQTIKEIKNKLGVKFGSVILSALSAGIHKYFAENEIPSEREMLCLNTLPMPGPRRNMEHLTNYVTSAFIELPIIKFASSVHRLVHVHKMIDSKKNSLLPLAMYYLGLPIACHLHFVRNFMATNNLVPTVMTNNAGPPINLKISGKSLVNTSALVGGGPGVAGVVFLVYSHVDKITILISAEKSVMSKADVKQLAKYVTEEIYHLYTLT